VELGSQAQREPRDRSRNPLGRAIDWLRRQRNLLTAITVLPVVLTLGLALAGLPSAPHAVFPCPLYPNGSVALTASLYESCPLRAWEHVALVAAPGSTLREIERAVRENPRGERLSVRVVPREGPPRRVDLAPLWVTPVDAAARLAAASLLCAILLTAVVITAARAMVPASLPFSLVHASVGVGIVTTVAGWTSSEFSVPAALARAILPAALTHLALVFPQRRGIVALVPELLAAPYVLAGGVCALELDAVFGGSTGATAFAQRVLLLATIAAAVLLAWSCALTGRESRSPVARGGARVFLAGIAGLLAPLGLTLLVGTPSLRTFTATLVAALLPFPVGYAVARHQVHDLDLRMRRLLAHVLTLSLGSGVLFLAAWVFRAPLGLPETLRHPAVLFAVVYAVLFPADLLRAALQRRVGRLVVSQAVDWDGLGLEFAQAIAAQRESVGVARAACEAVAAGLSGARSAVVLLEDGIARTAYADRVAALDPTLARALLAEAPGAVVDINRLEITQGAVREAYERGFEAFVAIRDASHTLGFLVIAPAKRGRLLASSELRWLATLASHAASALANLRLEQDLRAAERFAVRGKMHAELAHEISKPLGVLELTAARLRDELPAEHALAPRLHKLVRLAEHVRMLARGALAGGSAASGLKLAELVERALEEVRALHPERRIAVSGLPDDLELTASHERITRVLVNLLDNAARASPGGEEIALRVRAGAAMLELIVEDQGSGMSEAQLRRAFDPFTSFRPGGSGLGLTISRRIVEALGGRLTLRSLPGRGTQAMIAIPRAAEAAL
jgi:signal transduction histidine kinase